MLGESFVVDDKKTIAETSAAILTNYGYKALSFYSAEAALRKCDAEIPDLVMPGINGVDMAILIRERLSLSGNTAQNITSAMRW